jgi:hypothetical protein
MFGDDTAIRNNLNSNIQIMTDESISNAKNGKTNNPHSV